MKKLITKSLALFVLFFIGELNVNAQNLTFTFDTGGAVYTSGVGYFQTGVGTYNKSTSATSTTISSTAANCDGRTNSVVTSSSIFYFKPEIAISAIDIRGNGTSNNRTFSSIKTSSTLAGTFTTISNGTPTNNMATSGVCGDILIPGISVAAGTYIQITLSGNVNINSIVLTPACITPVIGTQPATTGQSIGQGATPTALTVAANGTGLSYQWYSNTTASNTGGTSLAPAGQASSFTPPTTSLGTTYYYCVVTGTCGSPATSNVSGAIIVTAPVPTISLTSGSNPAAATYNTAVTPVVYTYVNVANDNDVTAVWYSDNTYTTTTTAPSGLSISQNTTAKTMTLSGTPLAIGSFYYVVTVNEVGGNSINGSIVVSPPPAPVITGGTNSNTGIQPGIAAISNIVYTLTNSTGASVLGLPTGLSGNYSAGTYTISGTVDASVTPGLYPFTVTATALAGYTGAAITSTGTIVVKSVTAKQILYLAGAATPSTTDTRLYPMLNNSTNYILTVKLAASIAPAASAYSPYDVIILNEIVGSTNVEAIALKGIDKPILNLKNFIYGASKWVWATAPDNGKANNGTVTIKQPLHPIFTTPTNISVGSTLDLLTGAATKGIQPTDVTLLGSICVATAPLNAAPNNQAIAIHDVPASVRATNTGNAIASKYIMIPICNDSYNTMTDAALTLINNALVYLTNGTQFIAPSLAISGFNVSGVNATIDNTGNTITAILPISTDLTTLQPTITLAGIGTSVSPASIVVTDFSNSYATPINYTVTDGINSKTYAVTISLQGTGMSQATISGVSFDGQTIRNENNQDLQVFDATGRMIVTSNRNINMSRSSKGIYIVKSTLGTLKIAILD